jgi:hypothetical protein
MTEKQVLADACASTSQAIVEALGWVKNDVNAGRISSVRSTLDRELRRSFIEADRLTKALDRSMCVGVFGPSQAGKSYLISALARRETDQVLVAFDDIKPGLDFVRQINPEGGRESTGLVTRFSMRRIPTPAGFPVAVRLLSQSDLVKILGNTYLLDCELDDEKMPEESDLSALVGKARTMTVSVPGLREEDIWDIRDYFEQRQFKGEPIVRQLSAIGYWDTLQELAPTLSTEGRTLLFSMLWGQIDEFTNLCSRLCKKLDLLGNTADAFCSVDSLVTPNGDHFDRRIDSIVNVVTLNTLNNPEDESVEVCTGSGRKAKLARADLAALVAELHLGLCIQPFDFFDHTDLLDFPGARSRLRIPDVRAFLKAKGSSGDQAAPLADLFCRGKVGYLFERYNSERELTSILLCMGAGPAEVRTLPGMIKDWIDVSHGETPAARAASETALFFVLTKFDREFEQAAGQSEDSSQRWTTRIESCLTKFFGQAHDWPREWKPGRSFDNLYWLRNPNVFSPHILDYDAARREVAVRENEKARIDKLRHEFLENTEVRKHFHDPGKAWDEAFRLNDGGVSYLADSLRPVCNPDIKLRQIEARLGVLRSHIHDLLQPYYVPSAPGDRRQKRIEVYQTLVRAIDRADQQDRLGSFIRRLGVEQFALYEAIRARIAIQNPGQSRKRAGTAPAQDPPRSNGRTHKSDQAAEAAIECWTQGLYELSQDRFFAQAVGIDNSAISEIRDELIAAERRHNLRERIAELIRTVSLATDRSSAFADKASIIAGRKINGFVSSFGSDSLSQAPVVAAQEPRSRRGALEKLLGKQPVTAEPSSKPAQATPTQPGEAQPRAIRFDGSVEEIFRPNSPNPTPDTLSPEPKAFRSQYLLDWGLAMEDAMRANVEGGIVGSPEARMQNEILGRVLGQLERTAGP